MNDPVPTPTDERPSTWRRILRVPAWVVPLLLIVWITPFGATFAPAAERTLYFKLPIEGVRFHWRFLDAEAFLAGELTLRILNKGHDQTLVVFRDGKMLDGWSVIDEPRSDGSIYFGFETSELVRTKANDSLVITLKATKDLIGRGPYTEAVLPAGVYQMHGTYSSIYGKRWNPVDLIVIHGEQPVAYMECWAGGWPVKVTKQEGWRGAKESDAPGFFRRMMRSRGTNLRACESHY